MVNVSQIDIFIAFRLFSYHSRLMDRLLPTNMVVSMIVTYARFNHPSHWAKICFLHDIRDGLFSAIKARLA